VYSLQATQATAADLHLETDDDMTAIVARPLDPSVFDPDFTGSAAITVRRGRTFRIAVAAAVTALVGSAAMAVSFGRCNRDAPAEARANLPPDAALVALAPRDSAPPPAPPDAAPGIDAGPNYAILEIITDPPGATVYVGEDMPPATSPVVLEDLAPGEVVAIIEHEGYESKTQSVTLAARQRGVINVTLKKLPTEAPKPPRVVKRAGNGYLTARTTPYSTVYLGTRKLGVTPFARVSLAAGRHTLTFKNPSRKPYKKRVLVKSGQTLKLNFSLP
jgi:hypothetical protein